MKKMILTIALLSIVGMVSAQNSVKQEDRQQVRQERQQAYVASLDLATTNRNITFTALYMQPTFTEQVQVGPINNFLSIYPSYLDCALPYTALFAGLPIPPELDFMAPVYKYAAVKNANTWNVQISVENVTGPESIQDYPFADYTMHLNFSAQNGNATLTIIPENSTPITYVGSVRAN